MGAAKTSINLGKVMTKRLTLVGTVLRSRPVDEKIAVTQRFAREVLPGFARGQLHPVIDTRFALADAPDAHRLVESNATFGKVTLEM
jgi:NADPH:quinone reductase-like Zn-dependent oxidoreductase